MKTRTTLRIIAVAAILTTTTAAPAADGAATRPAVLRAWTFDRPGDLQGWSPGGDVKNVRARADGLHFETVGLDPLLVGPPFEPLAATNSQVVIVEMECDRPLTGELYYTNKTEGRYGGFEPDWMTGVFFPTGGRPGEAQSVVIWPFWEKLGKVNRIRFDPPAGAHCRLVSIRIVDEAAQAAEEPRWDFTRGTLGTWRPLAGLETPAPRAGRPLALTASQHQGVLITAVKPFEAASRPMLRVEAEGAPDIAFYWVTQEQRGILGMPVPLRAAAVAAGGRPFGELDLRGNPAWKGVVTHVGIGPMEKAVRLASLRIEPTRGPCPIVADFLGPVEPINRSHQPTTIRLLVHNASADSVPEYNVEFRVSATPVEPAAVAADWGPPQVIPLERLAPGQHAEIHHTIRAGPPGLYRLVAQLGGDANTPPIVCETTLRIEPPVKAERTTAVPEPKPVKTDYDIGVYYFPGWAPDPRDPVSRWRHQARFPERDPVLGWYREGDPEVADWHIKWAVENGIRFFIYDWYWRDGRVTLQEGLHDGLLKARHRDKLKFCIMWANHAPFADHTKEQLLQVTDYWIEHYFRLPNYYRLDGRPYISFFSIPELRTCMKTDEAIRDAFDAMRERARAAGLGGLYITACGDASKTMQEWYRKVGFDAVTAYNYGAAGTLTNQSPYPPYILAHEDIWRAARKDGVLPYLPLLTTNWDARPWHGAATNARFGRTTRHFEAGLRRLRAFLDETGAKVGILEAWNEWGEGSYLEPNLGLGFGDLEAVRRTFAAPGDWPDNIGPADVGMGPYDVRSIRTYDDGPVLVPVLGRIDIYPPEVAWGRRAPVKVSLPVPPIETRDVVIDDYVLVAGDVHEWHGGNRLWIDPAKGRVNLLPGSLTPGTVRIEPRGGGPAFVEGRDYALNTTWGAFSLTPNGRLKPDEHVRVSYTYSLRRVDAVALIHDNRFVYVPGQPLADSPEPASLSRSHVLVAAVYRPFNADTVEMHQIYPMRRGESKAPPAEILRKPAKTIEKLRAGQALTIVCWGDSVTACGESSTPDKCYVNLLESRLRERYPAANVRVLNAGIGGSSTPGRLPHFQKEVLDLRPDLVTLEFINDMGLPEETMRKNYDEILRRVTDAGAELVLITPHFSMPTWMPLPNGRGPDPRKNVAFLRRFAEENRVPLADVSKRWEQLEVMGVPYETLLRNGINHPDDRGHAIFADELMRLLE